MLILFIIKLINVQRSNHLMNGEHEIEYFKNQPFIDKQIWDLDGFSCMRHRKQKVTHICTENKCQNNPFLCEKCIGEGLGRSYHYGHDDGILKFQEGVRVISQKIRNQINPVSKIYKSSLGRSQYTSILEKLEKGDYLQEKLNERIISIKSQIQLQLNLLSKEFQKALLIQKQEYFTTLDNYQKTYIRNYDYIRTQTKALLSFQNSTKYFSNENSLAMKIMAESKKKTAWIIQIKKNLLEINKKIQTPGYIAEINEILSAANRKQIELFPHWISSQIVNYEKQKLGEYKSSIRKSIESWVFMPDLKNMEEEFTNKVHIPYQHFSTGNLVGKTSRGGNSIGSITKNYYNSNTKF